MIQKAKKVLYGIWIVVVVYLIVLYLRNPEIISPEYVRDCILSCGDMMMLVYVLATIIRGFFLIPSTPFVIAGGVLFPDQLFLVLVISMLGVMCSATMLYYFSDMLGFSEYLKKKDPKGIAKWESRLRSPKATYFVLGWSFFPLVPTDLICYVAGVVKMPYKYMFIGVFFGELVLDIFYVYFASTI